MKQFIQELNQLADQLDSKYAINEGGCCWFASLLAEYAENYNIPFKVLFCGLNEPHLTNVEVEKRLRHPERYKWSCYHVFLKFKIGNYWYNINRSNLYLSINSAPCVRATSAQLYEAWDVSPWNNTYDHKYDETISRIIHNFFKKNAEKLRQMC